MTDSNLDQLSGLKYLSNLDLISNNGLTVDSFKILKKFKSLKVIHLPLQLSTSKKMEKLSKMLPKLQIVSQHEMDE